LGSSASSTSIQSSFTTTDRMVITDARLNSVAQHVVHARAGGEACTSQHDTMDVTGCCTFLSTVMAGCRARPVTLAIGRDTSANLSELATESAR